VVEPNLRYAGDLPYAYVLGKALRTADARDAIIMCMKKQPASAALSKDVMDKTNIRR